MSPEQARGEELDHRSDIFSFGILLFEMLGGRNPFLRAGMAETAKAITSEEPPPLSYLPLAPAEGLERVARKCLEKEPGRRYASAEQLLRELRALRDGGAREDAPPPSRPAPRPRFPSLHKHAGAAAAAALALVVLLAAGFGYAYRRMSSEHTLAVLPINNQSGDPGTSYLSEGFTRSLFDKFSYLPRLRVRLPSVVPADRNGPPELARIGRELNADAVLSGRVFKDGQSLLLQLSLLRAEDAALVWEGRFDLGAADTLALQDEITREVASRLGMWLPGRALYRRQTDSEEALRLYMHGRAAWAQRKGAEDVQRAVEFFEQAVAKDPSFAKAYAGLADCYLLRNNVAYGAAGVRESMEKGGYNARKAVEAGDSLPESHTSLGMFKLRYEWDWAGAERHFRRALELDPDYAPAHYWYSNLLAARGRFDESVKEAEAAKSLDPYSPLSHMNYGRALYYARRYEEAAAVLSEAAERYPDFPQLPHMLALTLMQQGRYDEAVATLEGMRPKHSRYADAALGFAYGRTGRLDDAAEVLRDIDRISATSEPMPPQEKALVYIGTGDRDRAFEKLEETYADRASALAYLLTDPVYDTLRGDPRFADLARRVNLTP
jgi:serine/threonine-protein kinase